MARAEIEIDADLLRKFKALLVLNPAAGDLDSMISDALHDWVNRQILAHVGGVPGQPEPQRTQVPRPAPPRRRSTSQGEYERDASGISDGLADVDEDADEDTGTRDPEIFASRNGLSDSVLERDMEVRDPDHEAKGDASLIKEKKVTGSDSFQTPEQLFAEHSGLPTPPVVEDERAKKRQKKMTGRGKALAFTGHEENTI